MDELRLILLLLGVGVIGAIYFWGTRRRSARRSRSYADQGAAHAGAAIDPLERVRDEHAARNARALVGLDEFDIDADEDVVVARVDTDRDPDPVAGPAVVRRREPGVRNPDPRDAAQAPASVDSGAATAAGPSDENFEGGTQDERFAVSEPGVPITVRARRGEPEQLDLDGLNLSANRSAPAIGDMAPDLVAPGTPLVSRESEDKNGAQAAPAAAEPDSEAASAGRSPAAPDGGEALMLVFTIMAREHEEISGIDLGELFDNEGLQAGDDCLYHHHGEGSGLSAGPIKFSAVNVVKPGVFDPANLAELKTPGIALFMDADQVEQPNAVFDELLSCARRIADRLDARLCDHGRNPLTHQAENHLRESISEHSRRKLLRG